MLFKKLYLPLILLVFALLSIESCKKDTIKPTPVPPVQPPVTPGEPSAFKQLTPEPGANEVPVNSSFSWQSSTGAVTYVLQVSSKADYSIKDFEIKDLTAINYTLTTPLKDGVRYYWKVTALNDSGEKIAANAGLSFRTKAMPPMPSPSISKYFISPTGEDNPDRGTSEAPFKTLAYASGRVPAGEGDTLFLTPGTFLETDPAIIPIGVNVVGSGEAQTILSSSGVTLAKGIDASSGNFKLWYDGSLIQLASAAYSGSDSKYGSIDQMVPAVDGNQTLSGFTIDGNRKFLKAGIWVENRNNVTLHHVTVKDCKQRGAVFAKGNMDYYIPLPEGNWMNNTKIYNCTFINNGADLTDESLGNLCLAGLDGADIHDLIINEDQGYGIKFIYVGHFRNIKIHDCAISVPETDPKWIEDISIELWNLSYDNQIYNIVCNTWLSMVNHYQLTQYQPSVAHPSNLKISNVTMIDGDGSSVKESIECALSGVEIANSYFQDKGFGIAIWGGIGWGGTIGNHDITVRNNIFTNINRTPGAGFGSSAAVFIPSDVQAYNVKIYNNVFDNLWNAIQPEGSTGTDIRNNAFLNTQSYDVFKGASVTFNNNLKFHTDNNKDVWNLSGGPTVGSDNIIGDPGFKNSGNRFNSYYVPASASSLVIDKGADVGFPFTGLAPDIGYLEYQD